MAERTTGAYHLPGVSFLTAAWNLEAIQGARLTNLAPDGVTPQAMGNGDPVAAGGFSKVNRITPAELTNLFDHTLRFNGGEHVVLGGSAARDLISGGDGGDTIYGDAGDDYILTGQGADFAYGGLGDDVISVTTGFTASFGGVGNDYLIGGNGAAGTEQLVIAATISSKLQLVAVSLPVVLAMTGWRIRPLLPATPSMGKPVQACC